ncbi:hypothetical protein ALC60_03736 [Trachymyrmex zeteki]|uniref:Myb/SANT-like DNA-binding domain-containing protein n=1 Tax=Mycetomoellerius zeteki TaxID=64791 RepID=A0A151XAB5_9HYME|nr:hypothetical protein ALC60_03736 [Trachymyrmex zeteki]
MIFSDAAKNFMWPDNAVYLLLELYQEKEEMFNTSFKKHNILWKEIAASMRETSNIYNVTGQQCSNKLSGLKRTYRNIIDQNKKSGNGRNSWEFYSIMDSIFGKKASTKPPVEACSDGPLPPTPSTSNIYTSTSTPEVQNSTRKRKVESILENFIVNIREEREIVKKQQIEDNQIRQQSREAKYEEERRERLKMHNEKMEISKSLINILNKLVNK